MRTAFSCSPVCHRQLPIWFPNSTTRITTLHLPKRLRWLYRYCCTEVKLCLVSEMFMVYPASLIPLYCPRSTCFSRKVGLLPIFLIWHPGPAFASLSEMHLVLLSVSSAPPFQFLKLLVTVPFPQLFLRLWLFPCIHLPPTPISS